MRAGRSLVGTVLTMVVVATPLILVPSRAPASWAVTTTVAQDPPAVEEALGLDRPTRRLIQQGLRNEGFDLGMPDGLFGPRTRGAIRRWQEARSVPATGYLNSAEAELLRAVGAPPTPESEATPGSRGRCYGAGRERRHAPATWAASWSHERYDPENPDRLEGVK